VVLHIVIETHIFKFPRPFSNLLTRDCEQNAKRMAILNKLIVFEVC
jgi:hypothetical protein